MQLIRVLLTIGIACAIPFVTQAQKATVAVIPFEQGAYIDYGVMQALDDMLITELGNVGVFTLVERSNLKTVMDEQALGASGAVDSATAAEIGKVTGADYVLIGKVTEAGRSSNYVKLNPGRFLPGPLGAISLKPRSVSVAVDIRFVDTETSEVVYTNYFREARTKTGVAISAIAFDPADPGDSEMARSVLKNLSRKLVLHTFPPKVALHEEASGRVFLSLGSGFFEVGEQWKVIGQGDPILHPDTQEVLAYIEQEVGRIRIEKISDKTTEAQLLSGQAPVGAICREIDNDDRQAASADDGDGEENEKKSIKDAGRDLKNGIKGLFGRGKKKDKDDE